MSEKFKNNKNVGIALASDSKPVFHKGIFVKGTMIKQLKKQVIDDFGPKMYSICIFHLIKDDLDKFDEIIICNDENFETVYIYLKLLFNHFNKNIITCKSLTTYRDENNLRQNHGKFRSPADRYSKIYRKRGGRPRNRDGKTELNCTSLNLSEILNYHDYIKNKKK